MKYDYLIIGGGLGGLVLGIILAKENKRVCILEQHYKPGGYLHSFNRRSQRFETGFHFAPELDNDQVLDMYWGYAGILDKIELVRYNRDNFHTLLFPDLKVELPTGRDNIREYLKTIFTAETIIIDKYFDKLKELKSYFMFFNRDHKGDMDKEHQSFELTINDYLNGLSVSKELRAVLTAHSFLYGVPPSEAPLGTHAIFSNAIYSSAYDIKGGGDGLINAFRKSFEENGGEIKLRKKVINIKMADKTATGVVTEDGDYYEAANIVSSINPQSTFKLFDTNPYRSVYTDRINEMENTTSHFGLYALIDNNQLDKMCSDYLYFPDYDINNIYNKPVSSDNHDNFLYMTVPTARLGKENNLHVLETLSLDRWENYSQWHDTHFGKRPDSYKEFKELTASKIINQLHKVFGIDKDSIKYYEGSTPLTNYHFTGSPNGSMYGIKHSINQMRAPIRARTKVPNIFFTGQSLIFPGIVGVTITSFVTACEIFGMEHIFKRIDSSLTH